MPRSFRLAALSAQNSSPVLVVMLNPRVWVVCWFELFSSRDVALPVIFRLPVGEQDSRPLFLSLKLVNSVPVVGLNTSLVKWAWVPATRVTVIGLVSMVLISHLAGLELSLQPQNLMPAIVAVLLPFSKCPFLTLILVHSISGCPSAVRTAASVTMTVSKSNADAAPVTENDAAEAVVVAMAVTASAAKMLIIDSRMRFMGAFRCPVECHGTLVVWLMA